MSDKLQKLQEMMKLVNEGLSKQDFLDNFKIIVDLIKKLKADNEQRMTGMENRYDGIVSSIKENYDSDMEAVKEKALSYCISEMKEMMNEHKKKMAGMEKAMEQVREDCMPDNDLIASVASETVRSEVLPLIPTIDQIGEKIPSLGEPVRNALELLPEGEKLKIEAIEKLREELDELRKLVGTKLGSGGGGAVGLQNAFQIYDLSDVLDGVTKTFSVSAMTPKAVTCSSNPFTMKKTTDWTYNSSTHQITFTSAIDAATTLAAGQTVLIFYS